MSPGDGELARLAREAAPEVLAAALPRAREEATARLATLLADAIVAEALRSSLRADASPADVRPAEVTPADVTPAEITPTDEAEPAPAPSVDETAPTDVLYAYAIVPAELPLAADVPALTEGSRVGRVTDADLALLVSPLDPAQLRVDEEDLSETGRLATLARGHDAAVRAAAAGGPVLPLRFGTVVPHEEAARRLLRDHADAARAQLARIGDTREWGVRLVRTLTPEPVTVGAATGKAVHREAELSGTEYLARRRQALAEADRAEQDTTRAAERLEAVLAPHVTETLRRGGNPGSSLLLDLACLVAPDREADFAAAVADLVEELRPGGLAVELTGPWPPYTFATLDADRPAGEAPHGA